VILCSLIASLKCALEAGMLLVVQWKSRRTRECCRWSVHTWVAMPCSQ